MRAAVEARAPRAEFVSPRVASARDAGSAWRECNYGNHAIVRIGPNDSSVGLHDEIVTGCERLSCGKLCFRLANARVVHSNDGRPRSVSSNCHPRPRRGEGSLFVR